MKRIIIITLAVLMLAMAMAWMVSAWQRDAVTARPLLDFFDNLDAGEISPEDIAAERYYTMVDENGREIVVTGRRIHVSDEYITSDNKLYRVYKVEDRIAHARFIREVNVFYDEEPQGFFVMLRERFGFNAQPVQTNQDEEQGEEPDQEEPDDEDEDDDGNENDDDETAEEDPDDGEGLLEPEERPQRLIGMYHTHNAESYVPTDGTDSIYGEGGIHEVGDSFAEALREKGITVIHDQTLHLPHDRGAYRRSRVTAERILLEGPDVIFDVHRDAAPREAYAAVIEDEQVTQVQFVVGRQNANMQVIRQFALDLKNTADEVHPGLVKGIFMAQGNYNQDLAPTTLLLEVGSHTNDREQAEDGIALFADVVSFHFYGDVDDARDPEEIEEPAPGEDDEEPRGGIFSRPVRPDGPGTPPGAQTGPAAQEATRNIFRLLGITLFIIVGFLFINAVSLNDIRRKLAPYTEKLRIYNERVGHFLSPYLQPVLPSLARGDQFLGGWQEKIHATSLAILARTRIWLQNGDEVLAVWQEKIQATSVIVTQKTTAALESGDRFAEPLRMKIAAAAGHLGGRSRKILEAGDWHLAYLQEKIRDTALTVKENVIQLYARLNGRDKLR